MRRMRKITAVIMIIGASLVVAVADASIDRIALPWLLYLGLVIALLKAMKNPEMGVVILGITGAAIFSYAVSEWGRKAPMPKESPFKEDCSEKGIVVEFGSDKKVPENLADLLKKAGRLKITVFLEEDEKQRIAVEAGGKKVADKEFRLDCKPEAARTLPPPSARLPDAEPRKRSRDRSQAQSRRRTKRQAPPAPPPAGQITPAPRARQTGPAVSARPALPPAVNRRPPASNAGGTGRGVKDPGRLVAPR